MIRLALKSFVTSLMFAGVAITANQAFAAVYTVSTPGLSNAFMLTPSADSVTLNAASTSTSTLGDFAFQTGNYIGGDSGNLSGNFNYSVIENVTINGQTLAVSLSLLNQVTNPSQANRDTLTISQANPVFFSSANVFFNFQTYQSPGILFSGNAPFSLTATLVAGPEVISGEVPEPTTVALLGLGLLGFAASRRKSAKSKNS